MKELFPLIITAGIVFIFFLVSIVLGMTTKKKIFTIISVIALCGFLGLAAWTGYQALLTSVNKLTQTLRPRTGEEIYNALFGPDENGCVTVLNSQDQTIPRNDYATWIEFETCPDELQRILSKHQFSSGKVETKDWTEKIPLGETIEWVNPQAMGDTVLVFEYASPDGKNIQTLWTSKDGNKVLCRDISD